MVPRNTWLLKCHITMWEGIAIQERITLVFHTLAIWILLTASSWSHALWSHMTWVQIPAPLLPEWCWATYLLKPQSLRFFHYKTEVRNNTYMDKWNVLYIYNLLLFSHKKEGHYGTCYSMNESWRYYAVWNTPITKGQILYDSTSSKIPREVKSTETNNRRLSGAGGGENEK